MSDYAALIAELRIDHKPVGSGPWCATDGLAWPCPTEQTCGALEAVRQTPADNECGGRTCGLDSSAPVVTPDSETI